MLAHTTTAQCSKVLSATAKKHYIYDIIVSFVKHTGKLNSGAHRSLVDRQEATQLRTLSNWLISSWQPQSAYFSSGQQIWAKAAGGPTPGEEEAAARGVADDAEQAAAAAAAAAAEEAAGAGPEEFQELPPEQPQQAVGDKDEALHATELVRRVHQSDRLYLLSSTRLISDVVVSQAEDLADKLKRTLADMENLRQRSARQAENTQKFAIQVGQGSPLNPI